MFFKGSRYADVPDAFLTDASRRTIRFKRVRFIPPTPAVAGHRVIAGERLDLIAWRHYRDAERFWRICDSNEALWPDDLLVEGAIVGVPTSEG